MVALFRTRCPGMSNVCGGSFNHGIAFCAYFITIAAINHDRSRFLRVFIAQLGPLCLCNSITIHVIRRMERRPDRMATPLRPTQSRVLSDLAINYAIVSRFPAPTANVLVRMCGRRRFANAETLLVQKVVARCRYTKGEAAAAGWRSST